MSKIYIPNKCLGCTDRDILLHQQSALIVELAAGLDWLKQTVHRAHHDGSLDGCKKATCQYANELIVKARAGRKNV